MEREDVDKNRRNFLKILLIGSGVLVVGKILSPLLSRSLNGSSPGPAAQNNLRAFRVVENKKILSIYDNSGEEIFQIDKKG